MRYLTLAVGLAVAFGAMSQLRADDASGIGSARTPFSGAAIYPSTSSDPGPASSSASSSRRRTPFSGEPFVATTVPGT